MVTQTSNPIAEIVPNYSGIEPEYEILGRKIMDQLQRSPRGMVIFRMSDDPARMATGDYLYDGYYLFPAQYKGDAIPAHVLATLLGITGVSVGDSIEELISGWFNVNFMSYNRYDSLPTRPDPDREVYRAGDEQYLKIESTVVKGRVYVTIIVGNPCDDSVRGNSILYLTPGEARGLASSLPVRVSRAGGAPPEVAPGTAHYWEMTEEGNLRIMVRNDWEVWDIEVSQLAIAAVVNALIAAADKADEA